MAYNGSVELISGITQKNGGAFPLVDASAVRVTDSKRLPAALSEKLTAADIVTDLTQGNKAADAKTVGDALTVVQTDIDGIKADMYAYTFTETDVTSITGSVKTEGYYCEASTITEDDATYPIIKLSGSGSAQYDTTAFITDQDIVIHAPTVSASKHYFLAIGVNAAPEPNTPADTIWYWPSGRAPYCKCSSAVRYRSNDGNLPTSESPLAVSAGSLVVITVDHKDGQQGDTPYLYFGAQDGVRFADAAETAQALSEKLTAEDITTDLTETGKASDAKTVGDALAGKVDKVAGKGLSENDYTAADKAALDNIKTTDTYLATSGKAADAKATGDRITAAEEAIAAVEAGITESAEAEIDAIKSDIYTYEYVSEALTAENLADIPAVNGSFDATTGVGRSADKSGSVLKLAAKRDSQDTVLFFASETISVYADTTDTSYYSIVVGTSPTTPYDTANWAPSGDGKNYPCSGGSVRYKNTEGDLPLPTEQTPLTIYKGQMVAVTVTAGKTPKLYIAEQSGTKLLTPENIDTTLSTTGKAADAKATGDRIAAAETEVDEIETQIYGETYFVEEVIEDGEIKNEGPADFSGYRSDKASDRVNLTSDANYNTATFVADKDMVVRGGTGYYTLTIGTGPSEYWTRGTSSVRKLCSGGSIRYKNNPTGDLERPLPTAENPLTIHTGELVVVTVSSDEVPYLLVKQPISRIGTTDAIHLQKTTKTIMLQSQNYIVTFVKKTTTQGIQWNITRLCGPDLTYNVIPSSTDIIGVLRLSGQSNFMGGVHGNENCTVMRILSAGKDANNGFYQELHVTMVSDLYDPASTSTIKAERRVEFVFTPRGWTCRNTFILKASGTIEAAYPSGLFAVNRSECDSIHTNVGDMDLSATVEQRYLEKPELREAVINIGKDQNHYLTVNISSDTADKGFIVYRPSSVSDKIYFSNSEGVSVSDGSIISGMCTYRF